MGKKRVISQTSEEALKEVDALKSAKKQSDESISTKKVVSRSGRIYISVSYNNVRIVATNEKGDVIAWSTSGHLKFKGPKKATPFAASQVAENLLQKISKSGLNNFEVFVKGIGSGRDSALRTLSSKNVNITQISDITPIRHGGCRPRAERRV